MKNKKASPLLFVPFTILFVFCAINVRDTILSKTRYNIVQVNKRRMKRRKVKTLKGEYIIADTFVGRIKK